ncbi:hypothetical protein OnM2_072024 [Erysiphe neolycopersici]|uniref:Uncharacterized protein n=1 Tax=Erysiphe neolycopersici TaxID=212602 RepID=A0A420HK58_9PEZI|nr:hypothetical protein OnM2_072024 [Erysiphe neolycopersici]
MSPPILPAYSLRVQLFLSTACDSEDKPVRNFRVVTSPEITVREFCEEASRIHEINYGEPLVIKRVQDDQAFDVTQSEILGNLFGTSSIVRVVQASKHSGIRDSIPPTSALRFNPLALRKRERYHDDSLLNLEGSWRSNKRQKICVTDPDSPLPSRESDAASLPNPSYMSHTQVACTLGKFGNTEKYYSKKSKCQISETPEPVSTGWQNLRIPETRSFGIQKYSKSDYHGQQNSYNHNVKKNYRNIEPSTAENESTSQHFRKVYSRENSASSAQGSIYLGQSPAKNAFTQSSKLNKNPFPVGAHNDLKLNTIHNQAAKKKNIKYDVESLKTEGINNLKHTSNSSEKTQSNSKFLQNFVDGKLVTEISRGDKVLDTTQINYSLEAVHSEKITSKNLNCKTPIEKVEHPNNCVENSINGTDIFKEIQAVNNKQKKKKRRKKKEITLKSEPPPISLVEGAQNRQEKKPSEESETSNQNIGSSVVNREQISPKETKLGENQLISKTVLNGRKSHLKPTDFTEKLKDDLNSNSPSLKSISRNIVSNSEIPPPRERNRNPTFESLQAQNSSLSETPNQEKSLTNNYSNHILPTNSTIPSNEEKKKDVATKISNQMLPDTPASLQTKSSTPNSSNTKDIKCIIPLQKKSFTPILPPQKAIDISNILIASDDRKTRITRSKTASAAKIIPTKITPIVPNKKSQPTNSINKTKLPNGISNKESISINPSSKEQDLNHRNCSETNESFSKNEGVDEALANSIIEKSSNKESIQEASIISQPKNLKELQITTDSSKTEDDEINREEAQSQNSSDRDSRSPIEFHQNFQPKISHRTPSLSSNSHSDIEDSKLSNDTPSSVLDDSDDSSDDEVGHKLDIQEKAPDNSHIQIKPTSSININTQIKLEHQQHRPNSPHSILRVQVPNSSPASKHNLSSNHLTNSNVSDLSHGEAQGNPSNSFISGPVVVPSSSEVKKPQFKFGASLSEIHRSGGLLGMSQTNHRSNEQNILAMSLATETQSESESEDSDSSS